jgi:hypothetical protein
MMRVVRVVYEEGVIELFFHVESMNFVFSSYESLNGVVRCCIRCHCRIEVETSFRCGRGVIGFDV